MIVEIQHRIVFLDTEVSKKAFLTEKETQAEGGAVNGWLPKTGTTVLFLWSCTKILFLPSSHWS